ncbi:MAG: response regulator, partial [Silicimonas sp.]|nr:response regulator [Silicimonas sp.]
EAEDAEEALSILEDDALQIDLFLSDVVMPGMDGPTWVRQAHKTRPDTHVIFMSGYSEEGRVEKQARVPNSVFLPKPFSLHQLTSLVHEQLH